MERSMTNNPRRANGARRDAIRKRWRSIGAPCWLCGKPIDYSLPAGHPMSFEVDEVVPVSKGGDPLDFGNTRPAHRSCNQRRGNKTVARATGTKAAHRHSRAGLPTSRDW